MNIKKIIDEVTQSGKPLVSTHLADLAQLTPANVPVLKAAWTAMPAARRRQVVIRLVELARDNVEFNFDIVFRFCLTDADADVRTTAIDGLWENEDPQLIKMFVNLLEYDPSDKVKASAATALGRFAVLVECGEIRPDYGPALARALFAAFENTSLPVEVRRRALESVAPLNLPAVREAIKKAYESRDERFTVSAIFAMGRTCDEAWLPIIVNELDNADAEIRYEAAGACGEIGVEDCVGRLLEHTDDSDAEVRLAVIQALGRIGGREAKQGLQRLSASGDTALKEAAEQALAEIETAEEMTLFEMKLPGDHDDKRN
jgi:HEAT repeat protein